MSRFKTISTLIVVFGSFCITSACQSPAVIDRLPAARREACADVAGGNVKSGGTANPALQHTSLLDWAARREAQIKNIDDEHAPESVRFDTPAYLEIPLKSLNTLPAKAAQRIEKTTRLYFETFGRNSTKSLVWTGIESGNPLTRHEDYRWDSLKEEGIYDPVHRKTIAAHLVALGIRNVRLGMSNHLIDIDNDSTWQQTTEIIEDFAKAGLKISLDLHHFGIEDRFRVTDAQGQTIGSKSYYLNPAWPDYFARFAQKVVQKYHKDIAAITIMNEPETVIGFNGEMWNGGFPGWADKDSNRWYIERAFQVAKASIKARLAIEDEIARMPKNQRPHFLYMHTEASVYKPYWSDFNVYRRFVISDLILGHGWFLDADTRALAVQPMTSIATQWGDTPEASRTIFHWVVENYLVYNQAPETREVLRQQLVTHLRELQALHRELKMKYRKTMKTDTVFAVDYYAQNEDKGKDNQPLDPQPQFYAEQIKAGNRAGYYNVIADYFNHFQIPMMGGESGTPYYYYGARWNEQMLLEAAQAAGQGIPYLGYTMYPAVDTWGWESACSVPRDQALYNPSGLMPIDSMEPRPFVQKVLSSLHGHMDH